MRGDSVGRVSLLPAPHTAGRDINPDPRAAAGTTEASGALQTTVHLTMRCG